MVERFLIFFTIVMIPLSILGPSLIEPKVGPIHLLPHWLLIIISIPIFVVLLLGADLRLKFGLNIKKDLHVKPYIWFLVFWLLYGMASLAWTSDKLLGLKELILFSINIGLVLLIIFNIVSIRDIKIVMYLLVGILIFNFFVAYLELFHNYHLATSTLTVHGARLSELGVESIQDVKTGLVLRLKGFVSGTFYNPNALGTFVGLTLPLIFSIFVRGGKRNLEKILGVLLCILGVILSIYIRSRTLYGVLLIVVIIYFWFYTKFHHKLLLSLGVGISIWSLASYLVPFFELDRSFQYDPSFLMRLNILSLGKERFLNSFFLLGTGAGSFYDMNLHNWYAEILFKFGFFIFGGYLLFYFHILRCLYLISKKAVNRSSRFVSEGLFVSLCGYSIGCISDSSRLLGFDSWIIIGLSLVIINMYRCRRSNGSCNYPLVS